MKEKETIKQCLARDAFDLVKLNLIFFVCCLPLISIPAAITAMTKVNLQMQRGDKMYILSDFLDAFREEFFDSLICGLAVGLCVLVFGYIFWFYQSVNLENSLVLLLLRAATVLPLLILYCASCYLWPMNVIIELPRRKRLRNALSLSIICLRQTLICLVTGILFAGIGFAAMPYSTPFVILAGFSFWNYICTYYTEPMIKLFVADSGI